MWAFVCSMIHPGIFYESTLLVFHVESVEFVSEPHFPPYWPSNIYLHKNCFHAWDICTSSKCAVSLVMV